MVKKKELFNCVIRSASKITEMTLPTVDELYESCVTKKTADITKSKHLSHCTRSIQLLSKSVSK